ncbi:hypothetical protein [Powai lake megavirus]|uniref:Uncharacterized protein n=1 Tax=Powai lake megavirus TaxID=1842663 RepID=A0A167RAP5_9VIRU|nr:hypothetical protein QJ849_gp316 [Powai lake megavirus]ANB50478.1 hypothetical protein [Powai lake megavirus]
MTKLAIIGISGRNHNPIIEHYNWMIDNIEIYNELILCQKPENIILVSGGSSWADHIAISLFLTGKFKGLHLYLPTYFNCSENKYINDYQGLMLNDLHTNFSKIIGINSLDQLSKAINNPNCITNIHKGFFERNTKIAQYCDHLIAFSFGDIPTGGTLDTWKKIKHNNKTNINLKWM